MNKDLIQKRVNEIAEASERRARGELNKRILIKIKPEEEPIKEEPIKEDQPEPEVEEVEEEGGDD